MSITHLFIVSMDSSKHPLYQGFIAAAVSGVFFGCNYVPVKKFDAGDGKYPQSLSPSQAA